MTEGTRADALFALFYSDKRDHYAELVLPGLAQESLSPWEVAERCWEIADSMVEKRRTREIPDGAENECHRACAMAAGELSYLIDQLSPEQNVESLQKALKACAQASANMTGIDVPDWLQRQYTEPRPVAASMQEDADESN